MANTLLKTTCCLFLILMGFINTQAQIVITPDTGALRLVQQLVGNGVAISNCRYTGANGAAGKFKVINTSPALGIDSGIVLSTGYVKTGFTGSVRGIDYPATGTDISSSLNRPGDTSLATILTQNYDAAVLEFDFIPAGDTILFRYSFASEEYPKYNCSQYNDVFGFFVSGPGITGNRNIALVPGTNIPVAINSINNGTYLNSSTSGLPYCTNMGPGAPFTQYYVNNQSSTTIAFNGFTVVLEAKVKVQPCQQYHLKLAIADGFDRTIDSGVFLEAKSLRSSGLSIRNAGPTNTSNQPFLAEGCQPGGVRISRRTIENYALPITLAYGGTATNGTDVAMLPAQASIPANDSSVFIPITPLADQLTEGIEVLKIYVTNGCSASTSAYADSITVLIGDYDSLHITPAGSAAVCHNGSLQLAASPGHTTYSWEPANLLNNASASNPIATPGTDSVTFVCTAVQANCRAKDSVKLIFKKLLFISKQDVVCRNAPIGQIKLATNQRWQAPLQFWVNNQATQADSTFNQLPAGTYMAKIKDATGCTDSLPVSIVQTSPSLYIQAGNIINANCTDSTSGSITPAATGGLPPYLYSVTGTNYTAGTQPASVGNHQVIVKDANNCTDTTAFTVAFNNPIVINAGADTAICLGTSVVLQASTTASGVSWYPTTALSNANTLHPQASPTTTMQYVLTAQEANCRKTDTVLVSIRPAPIADAGPDTAVCVGGSLQLNASGGVKYQWSPTTYLSNPAVANPTATPFVNIRYQLSVTDQYNCSSLQPDEILVRTVPAVVAFAGRDTLVAAGQPLQLMGMQVGNNTATQFTWSPASGLNNAAIINPIATLYADQTYRLTLRTPQGCEGYDEVKIKVFKNIEIYVPSGFSPNSDGRNDVLRAIPVGIKTFKYFNIYNRWGQLIFHTTTAEKGWDGKMDGKLLTAQSFVWMAEGIDYTGQPVKRTGMVTLIP